MKIQIHSVLSWIIFESIVYLNWKVSHEQSIKFQRKSYNRNWPEVNHVSQLMRELLVRGGSHIVELVENPPGAMDHDVEIMKMLHKVHLLGNIHAHSYKGPWKSNWVGRRLVQKGRHKLKLKCQINWERVLIFHGETDWTCPLDKEQQNSCTMWNVAKKVRSLVAWDKTRSTILEKFI